MVWTDETNPIVDFITYGDLMTLVDMRSRWMYKGSVTNPPCARFVLWNVLSNIYPIKKRFLDQFVNQEAKGEDGKLAKLGNHRYL